MTDLICAESDGETIGPPAACVTPRSNIPDAGKTAMHRDCGVVNRVSRQRRVIRSGGLLRAQQPGGFQDRQNG